MNRDEEEGRRHVLRTIEQFHAYKGPGNAEAILGYILHLKAARDSVLYVCFGDEPVVESSILSTYVIPGMPLDIEFSPLADERVVQPLLIRCSTALDYEITKDRRVNLSPAYTGLERRKMVDRRFVKDRRKAG